MKLISQTLTAYSEKKQLSSCEKISDYPENTIEMFVLVLDDSETSMYCVDFILTLSRK